MASKFYQAVLQAILLYGSRTWNLTASALARLEGFHIRLPYKMVQEHQSRKGANHVWTYPRSADVLEECRMRTVVEYIANDVLRCMWQHGLFWRCAGWANGKEG